MCVCEFIIFTFRCLSFCFWHNTYNFLNFWWMDNRKLCEAPYNKTVDWAKWYIFWVDERVVSKSHTDSNYKLAKDNLLSKVCINVSLLLVIDAFSFDSAFGLRFISFYFNLRIKEELLIWKSWGSSFINTWIWHAEICKCTW